MPRSRRRVRYQLAIEPLEHRLVPSGAGTHGLTFSGAPTEHHRPRILYVAHLSPANEVLPVDDQGFQIQGGGGAAMYPLPPANDPARGTVTFYLTGEGKEIDVSITLSAVSNASAITINDLADPAAFALRGSPNTAMGQTPAATFNPSTVNLTQQSSPSPGQITAANIGQAVVVLLKPGPGSGTISHNSVQGVVDASDLTGPMAGQPISALIKAFRQTVSQPNGTSVPALYVNVETSNGFSPAMGAQQDGNFPSGELRGAIQPFQRYAPKSGLP
jgi:hypothetical protein